MKKCKECKGHGKEICNNPDHGGIESGLYGADNNRLGCPVCGHDPYYRTKYDCEKCNGTGKVEYDCETCQDTGEVTVDVFDNDSHTYQPTGTGRCPDCMGEDDADFSGATEGDR